MHQHIRPSILTAVVIAVCMVCSVQGQTFAGEEAWRFETGNRVVSVAESQDGLYSGASTEKNVYFFDRNGTVIWSYPVSRGRGVAVSSEGKRIVSGGDRLLVFDKSGRVFWSYTPESQVRSVAIDADAYTVYAGIGTALSAYRLDEEQKTANVSWSVDVTDPIESVSIGGSSIVVGTESGNVCFINGDGRLLWTYRTGSGNTLTSISRDGSTIAAAPIQRSFLLLNRNGNLFWKHSAEKRITGISISGDGSTIVIASGNISSLNRNGEVLWTYLTDTDVRCVSISSDATRVLTGAVDGSVSLLVPEPQTSAFNQSATPVPDVLPSEMIMHTGTPLPKDRIPSPEQAALTPAAPLAVGICIAVLAHEKRKRIR